MVLKPTDAIFEAIVNPGKLSKFFISRASGPIKKGERIAWFFDDVGGELSVSIKEVIYNTYISFDWAKFSI